LTNQDSVGGKNSSVLSDVKLTSQQRHWNQATFLTGDGIKNIHEKGFKISKTKQVGRK